jgi:hypothetical protein
MDSIRVWQPLGEDTPLAIERPSAWPDSQAIQVYAIGQNTAIEVNKAVTANAITFDWNRIVAGVKIVSYVLTSDVVETVEDKPSITPAEFHLLQNYPNPFNATTKISFMLPHPSWVQLEVFNLIGEKVATLVEGRFEGGYHSVIFEAAELPSGVYVYRVKAGKLVQSRKLLLLR